MPTAPASATVNPPALPTGARVAVVGAGIVGASVALQLQRAGLSTWLVEPRPPGQGASYGNAGLVSVDSCVPVAMPGLLRQLPGMLLNPEGPLTLRAAHLLPALPWLLRRLLSGRASQVLPSSDAMRALHAPALAMYRALLGPASHDALLRQAGQVHVWAGAPAPAAAGRDIEAVLRERHGISAHWLSPAALADLVPGIAATLGRALYFPHNAHTVDPRALVQALVRQHADAGGRLLAEQVHSLLPQPGPGLRLLTDVADHRFDAVVLTAGLASAALARPLGLRLPLQAERGYHLQLPAGGAAPPLPVVQREQGFVATPMAAGLRLAGTVEIAAAHAPPNQARAMALLRQARALLPGLDLQGPPALWLGSRPSTPDGLPIIDSVAALPGLYLACGHSHFGLTGAPMTGRLLLQMLRGQPSDVPLAPYRLARFHGAHSRASSAVANATSASNSAGALREPQR